MGLVVLACALGFAGRARAAPPAQGRQPTNVSEPSTPANTQDVVYDDYRLTLLACDGAAVSMVILGAVLYDADDSGAAGTLSFLGGAATYVLGGPIVHFAHEQPGRGFGSLALRLGLPTVGVLIGFGLAGNCESECYGRAIVGGVAMFGGVIAASIIDDGFLGKVPKAPAKQATSGASTFRARFAPIIDPKRHALGLSLLGAF